jgi:serine O-acetyltransferase
MKFSISHQDLCGYVAKQINHFFPDGNDLMPKNIESLVLSALHKLEFSFRHVNNKYFEDSGFVIFDHLHGDQYSMFLYLLSRESFLKQENVSLSKKLYLLNKLLFGLDVYFEVQLPSIFLFVHPVGTVLGRAKYGDYLVVYQRVGVGSNQDIYPILGDHVTLHPGASILGNSHIGNNCTIAAESFLLDKLLPDDSIYIGSPKNYLIKSRDAQLNKFWKE